MPTRIDAVKVIRTDQLRSHPRNVRTDLGDTDELARSLRTQGLLQPLLVAPRGDVFVVIDGHRRLAAARQARIDALPCLITTEGAAAVTTATMLAAAMHQRLAPLDQAHAFHRLTAEGMSIEQIAAATGYTTRTVRERLDLMDLPPEAQQMVADKTITLAAARDLVSDAQAFRDRRQTSVSNGAKGAALAATKESWLNHQHRLADQVKAACRATSHRDTRVMVGGVACGQCWEKALAGQSVSA